jgi:pimeloyl-ACP methyl ester carboxylesterase
LCDNDHFIPASLSELIAESIPGALYREIPQGGHIPFIERPRQTAAAVCEFIASLSPKESPARIGV